MAVTGNNAVTPQTPKSAIVTVTAVTASHNTDTPTNVVKLLTPGADGARLVRLEATPRGAGVAGRILIFRGDASAKKLWRSKSTTAYSWSTTVDPTALQAPDWGFTEDNAVILTGPTDELWVGLTVAATDGYDVYAEWANY